MSLDEPFDPFRTATKAKAKIGSSGGTTTTMDREFFAVELPSGATLQVPTEEEAGYLERAVDRYRADYALTNVSDLGEVDRCIGLELQMHRIQVWLGRRVDYDNKPIDENAMMQRSQQLSSEIRQIKKTLGIDKVNRDRTHGRGSVNERMTNLLERARRFGLMRNEQQRRAIVLANQLESLMTQKRNAKTEKERRMLAVTDEDIFQWIETVFIPEFREIDEAYRAGDQKMWILAG